MAEHILISGHDGGTGASSWTGIKGAGKNRFRARKGGGASRVPGRRNTSSYSGMMVVPAPHPGLASSEQARRGSGPGCRGELTG
jgi:hypothetical protein